MDASTTIAVVAVVLSALTFVATQFGAKRTATSTYVEQLESRVEYLEQRLEITVAENERLHDENFRLLRRLAAVTE